MASVYHFEPFHPRADVARTGKARPPRTVAKRDNAVVLLCAGVGLGMFLLADHGRTVQSHTVGLAQSAVLLHCVGVFIAYYNGYRRFPTLYKVWEPFKGGVVFETLQAVAWVLFTLAQSPPPPPNPPPAWGETRMGGDRHLAQKAQETLGSKGAEENFSLGYTGTGVGGNRHLVTVPPPPRGGTGLTLRGGGITRGAGGKSALPFRSSAHCLND